MKDEECVPVRIQTNNLYSISRDIKPVKVFCFKRMEGATFKHRDCNVRIEIALSKFRLIKLTILFQK